MKRILFTLLLLSVVLAGCTKAIPQEEPMKQWAKEANLSAEETAEELYEKALEEGVLTVYTVSLRIADVAESFEEAYPGLQVDVIYTRHEELVEKVDAEILNGTYGCDLIFCNNVDGSLTENLFSNGKVYKYTPWDMKDVIRTGGNEQYVSVLVEVPMLTYNEEVYDTNPVSNWWELTEPQWEGKLYITNPTRSMISYALFSSMQKHEEELEQAYEKRYGTKFEAVNGEGAFKTFLRKLVENGLHAVNDSDDVADAIGKPGMESRGLGILNTSKYRLREAGYPLAAVYEMEPFAGVTYHTGMMLVGGSKNVNAAKLFIRWTLGETDGSGEGYAPFRQAESYPSRTDVDGPARSLDSFETVDLDEQFSYENREEFLVFWDSLME